MTKPPPTTENRSPLYLLLATLAAYLLLQLLWVRATPLQAITLPDNLPAARAETPLLVGLGPDEKEHFLYIVSLAETGRLPRPSPQYRTAPDEYVSYQAQHPPLFYAAVAVVYRLLHGAAGDSGIWYVLRGLCVLCGASVIIIADKAAKAAFPNRPLVALGTAPCLAFLPMFGHMTGCLSNEPLAMVFGALVWMQAVRLIRRNAAPTVRDAALLGATLGIACLTRLTALLWIPVVAVALLQPGKRSLPTALAALAAFVLLLAPWLLYNQVAYGHAFLRTFDRPLLAHGSLSDFFGRGIVPAEFPVPVSFAQSVLWFAGTAWLPYWLTQFYAPLDLRPFLLLLSAGVGILLLLKGRDSLRSSDRPDTAGGAIVAAAFAALAFCVAALFQQELFSDWNAVLSAGRYLVAAAPASMLLLTFALSTVPALNRAPVAAALAALMLVFDGYAAMTVSRFYADHPQQRDVQPITRRASPQHDLRHGNAARLAAR